VKALLLSPWRCCVAFKRQTAIGEMIENAPADYPRSEMRILQSAADREESIFLRNLYLSFVLTIVSFPVVMPLLYNLCVWLKI
jgi:hypothetical protein